ncbi:MAG: hypothetical protein QOF78_2111 [Phycisphaerales bacterium]|nr:hypothetical protein [Phycisphaerales bacterium]
MSMFYMLLLLTILFASASFALDYGRVQLSKSQLQIVTDSAARWAAPSVGDGKDAVLAKANQAAADNKVNGVTHTFLAADLQVGSWNTSTRVFTPNGSPSNAIKLTTKEVIPLMLGNVIRKPTVTVRSSAIAYGGQRLPGFTGLDGFDLENNAFIGSYKSATVKNPNHANRNGKSSVGSNGVISAGNNSVISGNLVLGPGGSNNGLSITDGGSVVAGTPVVAPAEAAWNPGINPNNISKTYSVSSNVTLPGGTYWFTSLTVTSSLTFSGPAIVYINGDFDLQGSIKAYQNVPSNLRIYQIGHHTFGNIDANGAMVVAVVSAPKSSLISKNNFTFYGSGLFKNIDLKNNADLFVDEDVLMGQSGGGSLVQ